MTVDPFEGVHWHDAHDLTIRGLGWPDEAREQAFDRFPLVAKDLVEAPLWRLACQPAGVHVEFRCAADELFARWHQTTPMPTGDKVRSLAQGGLDCYGRDQLGAWRWVGSRSPWNAPACNGSLSLGKLDGNDREYRVYLPLSTRIDRIQIGSRTPLHPIDRSGGRFPIAYYGTSIVHGAGVSRPGMPNACQLSRMIDHEVLDLGFCGRAWCEPAVADLLGRLDTIGIIVDCLPNNTPDELSERFPVFLQRLREHRPKTPILLVEDRQFGGARFQPQRADDKRAKNAALHRVFATLQAQGMNDLHLAQHPDWFGADGDGTVDGSHPNDLGAFRMAEALAPQVAQIFLA